MNTAVAAQRLGLRTGLLTRFGADPFSENLKDLCYLEGIQLEPHCKTMNNKASGLYLVQVNKSGQRHFQYYRQDSAACYLSPEDVQSSLIEACEVVFASGISLAISEKSRAAVVKAFQLARKANKMTAFDVNYRPSLWRNRADALEAFNEILPLTDVVLPSVPEDTEPLSGLASVDHLMAYFHSKGCSMVVLKQGPQGCSLGFRHQVKSFPAYSVRHVVDTTGAGDCFNAGFLTGLIQKWSLQDCAHLALASAALKIQRKGTVIAMPNRLSVKEFLTRQASPLPL